MVIMGVGRNSHVATYRCSMKMSAYNRSYDQILRPYPSVIGPMLNLALIIKMCLRQYTWQLGRFRFSDFTANQDLLQLLSEGRNAFI